MIFATPNSDEPIDQGDLFDDCPVTTVIQAVPEAANQASIKLDFQRVIVLTQTCDLANNKVEFAVVASVFDASKMVQAEILKAAEIKGSIRTGRAWGWYYLPQLAESGIDEMIIDLRWLHSVRLDVLERMRSAGKRRARLLTPYREHLAKHFADTYSRIGLPQPYETM